MPLIRTFCTWFSIRMGSVIVAVTSLFQGVTSIGLSWLLYQWQNKKTMFGQITSNEENFDLSFAKPAAEYLRKNMRLIWTIVVSFLLVHVCGCLLLLHGCFQPKRWKVLPYVVMEFIRLLVLSSTYVVSMAVVQKNVLDFNILIVCLMCGGFTLLLLYYFWLCPLSFLQIIRAVGEKEKINEAPSMLMERPFFYEYLRDFERRSRKLTEIFAKNNT